MSVDKHPSVVVSNEGSRRFSLRWFRSLSPVKIAVIATVVLALLCGGTYYYFAHESTDDTAVTIPKRPDVAAANAPSAPLKPVDVSYVQLSDAELTSRVNLLISTKQYAEAEKLITMQNDLNTSKTKLSLLLTVQGVQNKKTEASQTAAQIEASGELSPGQYRALGVQYEEAGDKPKAIEFYNKAIDAYDRTKQGNYKAEVKRLQAKIEGLR